MQGGVADAGKLERAVEGGTEILRNPMGAPSLCRWQILNPASMKQALVEGAVRLPGLNLYEQVRWEGRAPQVHPERAALQAGP